MRARRALAYVCYDLAEGEPELAVLYAVRALQLCERGLTPRSKRLQMSGENPIDQSPLNSKNQHVLRRQPDLGGQK